MLIHLRRALALLLMSIGVAVGAPNKSPTVALTAPTSGTTFAAPANITLSANASDSDGTITRVNFYEGVNLLGTRTSAPYSITWSNVSAGSYSFSATAYDNAGAYKTSTKVSVTVTGARLLIATPINGATISRHVR